MPIVQPTAPAALRESHSLRDYHLSDRGTILARMTRLLAELHELETNPNPSAYFQAARITAGMSRAEIANDIIILCHALADGLDREYPAVPTVKG